MKRLALVAALLLACAKPAAPPAPEDTDAAAPASQALLATVTISGSVATVLLVNRSAGPVVMPGQVLDSAQLLLEVRDAKDKVLQPIPPPTPNGELRSIASGERLTRSLSLDVFSPKLTPGNYTVRAKGIDVESNVAPYRVEKR